jgi:hypothetical protein
MNLARAIVDQDEIVSRAVHLGETQHPLSSSIVYGESQGAAKSPFLFYLPLPDCVLALIYSAVKRFPVSLFFLILGLATQASFAGDYNNLILEQIKQMPQGGRYSVSRFAKIRLQSSAHFESGKFFILPSAASPSFCSGATYLVFIRAIETLRARGDLRLDYATLERLIIRDQRDGEGVWGRWNANGPGTARLFHELGLGSNFDNFDQAKPGDFMKIFWSRQVGKTEHGHSTIFLGMENRFGTQYVRYWSSNVPSGYGEKSVPRSKIAYAIFSRLEAPANLARISGAPVVDTYLASLLRTRSSIAEAGAKCGL